MSYKIGSFLYMIQALSEFVKWIYFSLYEKAPADDADAFYISLFFVQELLRLLCFTLWNLSYRNTIHITGIRT